MRSNRDSRRCEGTIANNGSGSRVVQQSRDCFLITIAQTPPPGKDRREGCGEREAAGLGIASLPSSEQRDLDRPPVGQDLPIQLQWSLRQRGRSCVEDLASTCWLATRTWLPPSTTLLGCLFRGYLPSISKHLDVDRSRLEVGHILSGGAVSVGLISEECTLYHTNQTR